MTNRKKYILDYDDYNNWYIFPAEKKEEFEAWIEYAGTEAIPEWVTEIDGPHSFTFENFELK